MNNAAVSSVSALNYVASTINVKPILQTLFASDPNGAVPTQIQAQLTWNGGSPQGWITLGTSGHSAGDIYDLAVQDSSAEPSSRGASTP